MRNVIRACHRTVPRSFFKKKQKNKRGKREMKQNETK